VSSDDLENIYAVVFYMFIINMFQYFFSFNLFQQRRWKKTLLSSRCNGKQRKSNNSNDMRCTLYMILKLSTTHLI